MTKGKKRKSPKSKTENEKKHSEPMSPDNNLAAMRLFQKGGPGGPGRPKGSSGLMKGYIEGALQVASVKIRMPNGKDRLISGKELLAFELVDLALHGPIAQGVKQRAIDTIINRIDGMPAQTMRTISEGKRLRIIFDEGAKNDSTPLPNEEGSDGESDDG